MCVYHGTGNIVVGNISLSIRHHFLENNLKASEQLNLKNLSGKVICICYSKILISFNVRITGCSHLQHPLKRESLDRGYATSQKILVVLEVVQLNHVITRCLSRLVN